MIIQRLKTMRLFAWVLCGLACASLALISCTARKTAVKEGDKLILWTGSIELRAALVEMGAKFTEEYGIPVQVDVYDAETIVTQFRNTVLANQRGPDAIEWAHDVIGEFAESGMITRVNIPARVSRELYPVALDAFTYKGGVYGYPYAMESVALLYNKAFVSTPPTTMEALVEMAQKLTDRAEGRYGFMYGMGNFYFSFGLLSAGGGYVFKPTRSGLDVNDVGLANAGAVAGANFIRKLSTDGIVPRNASADIATNQMQQQKLAMMINGPWVIHDLRMANIDFGVAKLPTLNNKSLRPFVGVRGFIVNQRSEHKDVLREFMLKHVMTPEGMLAMYQAQPRGPARRDVTDRLDDKDIQVFLESAADGMPMPNMAEMGAVWEPMNDALGLIIQERMGTQEALTSAVNLIKQSIERARR